MGTGPTRPAIDAILLCQAGAIDRKSKAISLLGIFTDIWFPAFPVTADPFDVYFQADGGNGVVQFSIKIVEPDGVILHSFNGSVDCKGVGSKSQGLFRFSGIPFKAPGSHEVQIQFFDDFLVRHKFEVQQG